MTTDVIQQASMLLKQVNRYDSTFHTPFGLSLENADVFYCHTVLRVVPGKRAVIAGQWRNKPVVAKIFYHSTHAKKHYQHDLRGIRLLENARIPTPSLLYEGHVSHESLPILLFEKIEHSKTVDELVHELSSCELMTLMQAITLELAIQHVLGILQTDLHLKNFLIASNCIYTLDGASIKHWQQPLSKKKSLRHLALFFSQIDTQCHSLRPELIKTYANARGWVMKDHDLAYLNDSIRYFLNKFQKKHVDKILRSSTEYAAIKTYRKKIFYRRQYESSEFMSLLNDPEKAFCDPNAVWLKKDRGSSVIRYTTDHHVFVIKRCNIKNMFHRLRRCVRHTRARKNWCFSHILSRNGIATAKPVACIENCFLGLRGKSYFISEYVKGPNIYDYISQTSMEKTDLNQSSLIDALLLLFKKLNTLQISHGDMKATNILMHQNNPYLIDLDGMKQYRLAYFFKKAFLKDYLRFLKNWKNDGYLFHVLKQSLDNYVMHFISKD